MNFKRMRRIEQITAVLVLLTGPLALMRTMQDSPPAAPPPPLPIRVGAGSGFAAGGGR